MSMNSDTLHRIKPRLIADYRFKEKDDYLQEGICPSCGKRDAWTYADSPWVIFCNRKNKCGKETYVKALYPDEFQKFNERFQPTIENPTATADAYLSSRGINTLLFRGCYVQESFYHPQAKTGTATVRFNVPGCAAAMERFCEAVTIVNEDGSKTQRKQNFIGKYGGYAWYPANFNPQEGDEVWITEAVIDSMSLIQSGVKSVAVLSCTNYPEKFLNLYASKKINWVLALDNDTAGQDATLKFYKKMKAQGFCVRAAQAPNGKKCDWNDLLQANKLSDYYLDLYRYHGALLTAESASEKAALMYQHHPTRAFAFDFNNKMYWFSIDRDKIDDVDASVDIIAASTVSCLCNAKFEFLYFQRNELINDSRFYIRVSFPDTRGHINLEIPAAQTYAASDFGKALVAAHGARFEGKQEQMNSIGRVMMNNLRKVEAVEYLGYNREHGIYLFNDIAIAKGQLYKANSEDYFAIDNINIKLLFKDIMLKLESDNRHYQADWHEHLWQAFGAPGMCVLTFWFASLHAVQIRHHQSSFPFLEIIGEPGSGKTSIIEFLWKLFGRADYEGYDPNKSSMVGDLRNMTQVSNLPVVYIEADRAHDTGGKRFDFDSIKPLFNGRGMRVTGKKNNGRETNDPPFLGTLVIAQNEPIDASDAVLERIIQIKFTKKHHCDSSKNAIDALQKLERENLSYFTVLACTKAEKTVESILKIVPKIQTNLQGMEGITNVRLANNHAKLIAAWQCLAEILGIDHTRRQIVAQYFVELCRKRHHAIGCDHPKIAYFWETVEWLDEKGIDESGFARPLLNHSQTPEKEWAININHVLQVARMHDQILPIMPDELKKLLKTSRKYPFIGASKVVHSAIDRDKFGKPKPTRCWVFKK